MRHADHSERDHALRHQVFQRGFQHGAVPHGAVPHLDAADVRTAAAAEGGRPRGRTAARLATGVLAPVATAVVVAAGLRTRVPGGLPAVVAVAFVLTLAWAVVAVVCTRRQAAGQAGPWPLAGGALAGAIALTAARLASQPPVAEHHLARAVATVAGPLVIAASVHLALAAPDGRLGSRARQGAAGLGYLAALGAGVTLALAGHPFPAVAAAVIWPAGAARHDPGGPAPVRPAGRA